MSSIFPLPVQTGLGILCLSIPIFFFSWREFLLSGKKRTGIKTGSAVCFFNNISRARFHPVCNSLLSMVSTPSVRTWSCVGVWWKLLGGAWQCMCLGSSEESEPLGAHHASLTLILIRGLVLELVGIKYCALLSYFIGFSPSRVIDCFLSLHHILTPRTGRQPAFSKPDIEHSCLTMFSSYPISQP